MERGECGAKFCAGRDGKFAFQFTPRTMKRILTFSILGACFNLLASTASWPQFRGPNASGIAAKDQPPCEFGAGTNLLWKVAVPSGLSSPGMAGERIFLTAFEDRELFALGSNGAAGSGRRRRASH